MNFNTEVIESRWDESRGKWTVKIKKTKLETGEVEEFEDECDLLLYATGILNDFKWPNIEGIEKFKGKIAHTARWPESYQEEEWKSDRVAVIGSGASSIQTVPKMQPVIDFPDLNRILYTNYLQHAKHLDVFVRTGVWFVEIANNFGANKEYSEEEKDLFRNNPEALVAHAKDIEDQVNGLWGTFYSGSEIQTEAKKMLEL
jgi:hypothetical protein